MMLNTGHSMTDNVHHQFTVFAYRYSHTESYVLNILSLNHSWCMNICRTILLSKPWNANMIFRFANAKKKYDANNVAIVDNVSMFNISSFYFNRYEDVVFIVCTVFEMLNVVDVFGSPFVTTVYEFRSGPFCF